MSMKWPDAVTSFKTNGFVLLPSFFDKKRIEGLLKSVETADFENLGCDTYFEDINGKATLRRVERSYDKFEPLYDLLNDRSYLDLLKELAGEEVCLFKDKINFKSIGGAGFDLHIDGHFFWQTEENGPYKQGWLHYGRSFLNAVVPLKATDRENGALCIAKSEVTRQKLGNTWSAITDNLDQKGPFLREADTSDIQTTEIEMNVGDLLVFDWICIHGSQQNVSSKDRPILYLTYNGVSDGQNAESYYNDKNASITKKSNKNLIR